MPFSPPRADRVCLKGVGEDLRGFDAKRPAGGEGRRQPRDALSDEVKGIEALVDTFGQRGRQPQSSDFGPHSPSRKTP